MMRLSVGFFCMVVLGFVFASDVGADERPEEAEFDKRVLTEGEVIASNLELRPDDVYGLWRLVVRFEGEIYRCNIVAGPGGAFDCHLSRWKP